MPMVHSVRLGFATNSSSTPAGTLLAAEIRKHKSGGGSFSTFIPGSGGEAGR